MSKITIQSPIDQPTGQSRLLSGLQDCLDADTYTKFRLIVAFAKVGPLLRLEEKLKSWTDQGKQIEAIFGIDEKGTSIEALEFSMSRFTNIYIAHVQAGAFNPTFHPKIYHFEGADISRLYIGSNNLTVGGIESNSETNVCLDFTHEEDQELLDKAHDIWDSTLTFSKALDEQLLSQLVASGMIVSEKAMRTSRAIAKKAANEQQGETEKTVIDFPRIKIVPPSALPKSTLTPSRQAEAQPQVEQERVSLVAASTEGLVIQISPHQNGEVFLSKLAVDQNRAFFDFPFIGRTTSKIPSNPSYPQRDPDPVVDINLFDTAGVSSINIEDYGLNTVFYEAKSEIRITVPQEIVQATPPFSILVMSRPEEVDKDYILDIYVPGSVQYESYLASCNQQMPSGGNAQPRLFGWL
ncbi:MAG TPA: phospholipase D family protein [Candidatus Saccharimonadales bacterium]